MNSHPKLSPLRPRYVQHRQDQREKRYPFLAGLDFSLSTLLGVSLLVSIALVAVLLLTRPENSHVVRTALRAAHLGG